jgi:hypothetical protein
MVRAEETDSGLAYGFGFRYELGYGVENGLGYGFKYRW